MIEIKKILDPLKIVQNDLLLLHFIHCLHFATLAFFFCSNIRHRVSSINAITIAFDKAKTRKKKNNANTAMLRHSRWTH